MWDISAALVTARSHAGISDARGRYEWEDGRFLARAETPSHDRWSVGDRQGLYLVEPVRLILTTRADEEGSFAKLVTDLLNTVEQELERRATIASEQAPPWEDRSEAERQQIARELKSAAERVQEVARSGESDPKSVARDAASYVALVPPRAGPYAASKRRFSSRIKLLRDGVEVGEFGWAAWAEPIVNVLNAFRE